VVKDEVDRIAERVKLNQSETINYSKNLAASLKRVRADQIT
jgi:hypothetical protein